MDAVEESGEAAEEAAGVAREGTASLVEFILGWRDGLRWSSGETSQARRNKAVSTRTMVAPAGRSMAHAR